MATITPPVPAAECGVASRLMGSHEAVPFKGCDQLADSYGAKFGAQTVTLATGASITWTSSGKTPWAIISSTQHFTAS